MKYENIVRLSKQDIDNIRIKTGNKSKESIKAIIKFYNPQLQECLNIWNNRHSNNLTTENREITLAYNGFNTAPNVLSVHIDYNGLFKFYLVEMFNNCGILVSSGTAVYINSCGVGTLLHAIKEDIAYLAQYSFLMYTDKYSKYHMNTKVMEKIPGIKKIFEGTNKRSMNQIAVYIKDIHEHFNNYKPKQTEVTEIKEQVKPIEIPF